MLLRLHSPPPPLLSFATTPLLSLSKPNLFQLPRPRFSPILATTRTRKDQQKLPMNTWASWKSSLGQRLNGAGLFWFAKVATNDPHLAIPHVSVPDIRWIDWEALREAGFRGVVLDKDNTITAPYSLALWPPLVSSFARCQDVFRGKVAILSNSAGLHEYDPDGSHAKAIEEVIQGVHILRHATKKPAGNAEEIEKYFGCSPSQLIMVGDRYFTDVVFGNRNGFLTILTEPLSTLGEPLVVQQVRKWEAFLVNHWCRKGMKAAKHHLALDPEQFVNAPPL